MRELPIERDQPLLFHHERTIARREAVGLGAQIVLLTLKPRDLLLRLLQLSAGLFLFTLGTVKLPRGEIKRVLRFFHQRIQPLHPEKCGAHILGRRCHDAERHRGDADPRKNCHDHSGMARTQTKDREFLLADACAEAVTDKGDDAANDRKDKDERNTIHGASPLSILQDSIEMRGA